MGKRNFFYKTFLFASPILIWIVFLSIVDPYNFINAIKLFDDRVKEKIMARSPETIGVDNCIWKSCNFINNPCGNILLGDSRIANLDELDSNYIEKFSNEKYFNFGIPGGDLNSTTKSFWLAAKHKDLKKVYINLSFHTFNDYINYKVFNEAEHILDHPLSYFFNRRTIASTFFLLTENKDEKKIPPAPIDSIQAWNQVLLNNNNISYKFPQKQYLELKKISEYCKRKNIDLYFIIFPHHEDVHKQIVSKGLDNEAKKFKECLRKLGRVYDFDNLNAITTNKRNFSDPYHIKPAIRKLIIEEVWKNKAE